MANVNDIVSGLIPVGAPAGVQSNSAALSSTTASAGQLSGSTVVIMFNTGATPGTYTTRTAAQMISDSNLQVGQTYLLLLGNNQGTGTLTLAGGTGVTVSGTATVAANVGRLFVVTVNTATTMTFTGVALSWTIAA